MASLTWAWAVLTVTLVLFAAKIIYAVCVAVVLPFTRGALYVSTARERIEALLEHLGADTGGCVYDLGCGDGRVLKSMARRRPIQAVGFELNPLAYACARLNCRGMANVRIRFQDFFRADLSGADMVFCYLFPDVLPDLAHKLTRELKPGARVVSCNFPIPGWIAVHTLKPTCSRHSDPIYVYRLPPHSGGRTQRWRAIPAVRP